MVEVQRQVSVISAKLGCSAPSRASLYNAIERVNAPTLAKESRHIPGMRRGALRTSFTLRML